jgi:hypothetical protein
MNREGFLFSYFKLQGIAPQKFRDAGYAEDRRGVALRLAGRSHQGAR